MAEPHNVWVVHNWNRCSSGIPHFFVSGEYQKPRECEHDRAHGKVKWVSRSGQPQRIPMNAKEYAERTPPGGTRLYDGLTA